MLVASLNKAHSPVDEEKFGLKYAKDQWLVVEDSLTDIPETQKSQYRWTPYLRKILPSAQESLRNCGLGHLLFVTEDDFFRCINSGS